MTDSRITIHQAFYGEVNKAHSCIKQTLNDSELTSFLITFTDRPAALPPGIELSPYLSGGSFSKYYLFAKVFPDASATRSGMVFTHVLILNIDDLTHLHNLQDLTSHFVDSITDKTRDIREFQISISRSTGSEDQSQPKYIQEIISSYISGTKPILFSGNILTFTKALQQIWNQPNPLSRRGIKFRASFSSADIEYVKDLTIVSIQKEFFPKWQGQKIISGENQALVDIESFAESLFLGYKYGNPFYDFLVELNVSLVEAQSYRQYENLFNDFRSLASLKNADIIRQDIRALARMSPSSQDGEVIKESFLSALLALVYDKKDSNLKALRNIDLTPFQNGEERCSQLVSWFVTGEIADLTQNQTPHLVEILDLALSESDQNWWHRAVIQSFRDTFRREEFRSLSNIWTLIEYSANALKNVFLIIPSSDDSSSILRKTIPAKLASETCSLLLEIARNRKWYLFHADVLLRQLSTIVSIERQLELERNLSLEDSLGLKYLVEKLEPQQTVTLALRTLDQKLIDLSLQAIEKDTSLLKDIDLSVPSWRLLWSSFVLKKKNVFFGLKGQEMNIVFSVLDSILQGVHIDETIISLISDSTFCDLSTYPNRKKIWSVIKSPYKEKFLKETSQSLFQDFLAGKIGGSEIETDIATIITSDSFITDLLSVHRNDIEPVLFVFSTFKNLKDRYLSDYIYYYKGVITPLQARKLGELVNEYNFVKTARTIYDKAKSNAAFIEAYKNCSSLVNLNWFESIFAPAGKNVKGRDGLTLENADFQVSSRRELPTVVILTAINEEYMAVREHLSEIVEADRNDTNYEAGIFRFEHREIANIIIRECGPKNTTAAQETERAIQYFHPNLILFVGIAGSRKPNDFSVGDVIFPEKVYSYEGGKSEKESFVARPDIGPITYALKEIAKKERRREDWKRLVKGNWDRDFKADLGTIASGEQVVEHYNSSIGEILAKYYNDTSAVEMEGYGFAQAANRQGRQTNNMLIGIVRGISDIIEQQSHRQDETNDRRPTNAKRLASATASAFAFWLIIKTYE